MPDSAARVAWLLAVTRLLSPHTATGTRQEFIKEMADRGVRLDPSRASRIEAGELPPAAKVITGYEAVTGVPAGSLLSVSSILHRSAGTPRPAVQHEALDTAVLDATFERIERRRASGFDWLTLAYQLEGSERVYLPPRTWTSLTDQLVSELTRSTGLAHIRRYEAAVTLLHDPAGSRHLTMSIGRFVMHPDAQSVATALSLLQEMSDHSAGDLVLRLMDEDNALLRRSAASVAGTLAARQGPLAGRDETLERHVRTELQHAGRVTRRTDAIDLASRLSEAAYDRVLASINDHRLRALVSRACASRELVERDVSRSTCEGIATYAEAATGRAAHDPDQMLRRLLREALFHVHHERRQLAAITIAASPYAEPVARATLMATTERDETAAAMCWALMRRLGHVITREQLTDAALSEDRASLRPSAIIALGLSTGELSTTLADDLVSLARDRAGTRLGHAATLALGMSGHPHLARLAALDGAWRPAALWWSGIGPTLHDA